MNEPTISLDELKERGYVQSCNCSWAWHQLPIPGARWWVRIEPNPACPIHKGI